MGLDGPRSGLSRLLERDLVPTAPDQFGELSDAPGLSGKWSISPRLEAVLIQLSKPYGTRVFCVLLNANIVTVEKLCATTAQELLDRKNCGKKAINALSVALASFGLHLTRTPRAHDAEHLAKLSDDKPDQWGQVSSRLGGVLEHLSNTRHITRISKQLRYSAIYTVEALCSAPLRSRKMLGEKTVCAIEDALGVFGLSLAEPRPPTKKLSPAQRRSSPVWLRQQIQDRISACDVAIATNRALTNKEQNPIRQASCKIKADCHRRWKRQLEQILAGCIQKERR